jgi:hypothetical protein
MNSGVKLLNILYSCPGGWVTEAGPLFLTHKGTAHEMDKRRKRGLPGSLSWDGLPHSSVPISLSPPPFFFLSKMHHPTLTQ